MTALASCWRVAAPRSSRRRASGQLRLEWPAGAPAPILPRPIDAIGPGTLRYLLHLPGGEEFHLAHLHSLLLQPRIDLEIDGSKDRLANIPACHGCAVAAHQRGRTRADVLCQIAAHIHVLDQQCGVAEMVMGIPDRDFLA